MRIGEGLLMNGRHFLDPFPDVNTRELSPATAVQTLWKMKG